MAFDGCAVIFCAAVAQSALFRLQGVKHVSDGIGRDHHGIPCETSTLWERSSCKPDEHANKPSKEHQGEKIVERSNAEQLWKVNLGHDEDSDKHAHDGFSSDKSCTDEDASALDLLRRFKCFV